MLTKSHYASKKFVRCRDKAAYRVHMCGLCHALGDDYGLPYRLLTTHDTILLNLLTSAQQPQADAVVMRRCPLNPLAQVPTYQNAASTFAAAVSVRLANISVQDDIDDGDGRGLIARLAAAMLQRPEHTAADRLTALGFDAAPLNSLTAQQSHAERHTDHDPAQPTAQASAALFAATAQTAGMTVNAPALATVGGHYGTYVYLADAYRDLADDLRQGAFNPLRAFVDGQTLTTAGRDWLRERLEAARNGMQTALTDVRLMRDADTVRYLLLKPLDELVVSLGGAAIYEKVCGGSCSVSYADGEKRKRKSKDSGYDYDTPKLKRRPRTKSNDKQREPSICVGYSCDDCCCDAVCFCDCCCDNDADCCEINLCKCGCGDCDCCECNCCECDCCCD